MQNTRRSFLSSIVFAITLTLIILVLSPAAFPLPCGTILSHDTVLTSDIGPCPGNGLIVGNPITLDLNGHTISGQGTGIGVGAGARITIFGPGTISNFGIGVRVLTGGGLANPNVISNLSLTGNQFGIVLPEGSGFTRIIGNIIDGGGVGISMFLTSGKIKGNVITNNSQAGINVIDSATSLVIVSNTVNANNTGLNIDFRDPTFSNDAITVRCNDFSGNTGTGVSMRGTDITFETNTVNDNGGDGIVLSSHGALSGPGNLIQDNVASANAGNGISVVNADGPAPNQIVDNQASGNGGFDLNWDNIGTNSCWKLNDVLTSNPATLPTCP